MAEEGSDAAILAKVEEFLLDDPEVSESFEKFADKHCAVFEDTEENKLVYMQIYNEFTELFNARVEGFIQSQGSSLEHFMAACENADEDSFAVQLILSITSFDAFKRLMLDQKEKHARDVPQQ